MAIDELRTIKQCQQGKLEEFGQLYDKYIKKIYDFIYFKTQHQETAKDLTSKTFIKALESIKRFKTEQGYFSAWLYTIARNTVIDHYRTKKVEADVNDIWDLSANDDIEQDLDTKEKLKQVEKYLSQLKTEHRDIIIMRVWHGMSYQEIAQVVGKSEASCKMMFSRTIIKLRQEMPLTLYILMLIQNIAPTNQQIISQIHKFN